MACSGSVCDSPGGCLLLDGTVAARLQPPLLLQAPAHGRGKQEDKFKPSSQNSTEVITIYYVTAARRQKILP